MAELSKLDRGDDTETVKLEELLHGRQFRGRYELLVYAYECLNASILSYWASTVAVFTSPLLSLLLSFRLCYSHVPFAVVFIGSTLFALQQLSGINAIFYFSSSVFKSAGVSSKLANVFIGIANLSGMDFFFNSFFAYLFCCSFNWCVISFLFRICCCNDFDG